MRVYRELLEAGESILLSQAIQISLEESALLSAKERSSSGVNGPTLRCNKCNKLGHTANRRTNPDRFPVPNARTIMSCFNCSREGHIGKDCRWKPTYRGGVDKDTDNVNKSPGRGWIRSGNGEQELSRNPTAARRVK